MNFPRLLAAAVLLLCGHARAQGTRYTLFETGPRSERINIVVLSEGYTAANLDTKFRRDAAGLVEALVAREPFATYRNCFNAYAIAIASNQDGADYPTDGIVRDTYFGGAFGTNGYERLLTISSQGETRAYSLLNTHVPEYDIPLVVVNDQHYGGSGGPIAVVSVEQYASEVAVHEIGHSFAGLGDEYEYAGTTPWEAPNTTQQTDRALIRWRHWINAGTPIPTPETTSFETLTGLFEGAAYNATGWYRPTYTSLMNELLNEFREVNEEAIALSILAPLPLIRSTSPAAALSSTDGQPIHFKADILRPAGHTSAPLTWYVDGTAVAGDFPRQSLIPRGATWRYRSSASAPPSGWNTKTFDDTVWTTSGPAPLGFGDSNEATVIPSGPAAGRYPAHYFRHSFNVSSLTGLTGLRLELRRDDGAVVYLNGTEIYRSNMATGPPAYSTLAPSESEAAENYWWDAALPLTGLTTGTNVIAVEVHQSSLSSPDLKFDFSLSAERAAIAGATGTAYVAPGGTWRYWDQGTPPAGWTQPSFNHNPWPTGTAELGYGDGGEAKVISYGSNASNKHPAAYFRREFTLTTVEPARRLLLRLKFDDGAAVYLNGTEVLRANLGWGTITHTTLAGREAPGDGAGFLSFEIDSAALLPGRNVIAAEVHQVSTSDADLSFDLSLRPLPRDGYTLLPATLTTGSHTILARYTDPTGKIRQDPMEDSTDSRSWTINVTAPADTDSDGLPDAWEQSNFGTLARNGTQDTDGDGQTNAAELTAGTHPAQSASRFAIVNSAPQPGGKLRLTWSSVPGRYYRIESSATLAAASWSPTQETYAASSPAAQTSIDLPVPTPGQKLFYRVRTATP